MTGVPPARAEAPGTRYLIIKALGGFGNRILSATTGLVLAELTGRTPLIDWRDGMYLPTGINAYPLLFDSPPLLDPATFDQRTDVVPAIWSGRLDQHPVQVLWEHFRDDYNNPFIYHKLCIDLARPEVDQELAVFWSYLPKMARIRRHMSRAPQFHGKRSDDVTRLVLSRYFRPNERIGREVDKLFVGRRGRIIGVHVRYTDRKVSLERIIAAVARLKKRVPDAAIFLATDNQGVQDFFQREFSNLLVIEKVLGNDAYSLHEDLKMSDPQREAENALIDMWALSSCDWLVHSRHSSFSVTAAMIGGIPRSRQIDVDRFNPRVVLKRWVQTWA
jgi:hypothetical protein